jgi:zinc transport system substrate-binding protein
VIRMAERPDGALARDKVGQYNRYNKVFPRFPMSGRAAFWIGASVFVASVGCFSGCGRVANPWDEVSGGRTRVLVSFSPLYCFAKQVGGPHAKVLCLATTVGPHHFEPQSTDVLKASKANLILYNGFGLDDEKLRRLSSSSRAELIALAEQALAESKLETLQVGKTKHLDHWHAAGPDPHVWLGLEEACAMVDVIRRALQRVDGANRDEYEKRAEVYIGRLKALHAEGQQKLAGKKSKIITTHDSLRYFARNFGLDIIANIQIQPGIEADADKLQNLVQLCGKYHPTPVVITTEPQYPKGAAETLAKELRARGRNVALADVDTLETADPEALLRDPANPDADYYLAVMRKNIDNLAKALE